MYNNKLKGDNLTKRVFGVINVNNINKLDRTQIIINILCNYLDRDFKDFHNIIMENENKYLLLLLLKNYRCLNKERIKNIFNISSENSVNYNIKKAEEKFLINKNFREIYFEIEKYLEEVI